MRHACETRTKTQYNALWLNLETAHNQLAVPLTEGFRFSEAF